MRLHEGGDDQVTVSSDTAERWDARSRRETAGVTTQHRRPLILASVGLALAVAVPALAASPSVAPTASPDPSSTASAQPTAPLATTASPTATVTPTTAATPAAAAGPRASKAPGTPDKAAKAPETAVSVSGTVVRSTDDKGRAEYTVSVGSTTWQLSAGPRWFWGDKNPLEAFVGESVRITGSARAASTELDVDTVDGKAIRADGKPPWAGGPWTVGPAHPGWKDWMADGKPGGGHGRDQAPGQLKQDD
jgi:hypothetical protein